MELSAVRDMGGAPVPSHRSATPEPRDWELRPVRAEHGRRHPPKGLPVDHNQTEPITSAVNTRGTEIRVGQKWCDNSPTRDPIRHFTITGLEEEYGRIQAACLITHGIDRATGALVPIDREVRIDINRLHPVRTGYRPADQQ